MRVDHAAARVVAALARDDHGGGPALVPLLAALRRDTPAFGGTTTVSTRGARPPWTAPTGLTALLRRPAPPLQRPSASPEPQRTPADHPPTPADHRPTPMASPSERPVTAMERWSALADHPSALPEWPSASTERPARPTERPPTPAERPSTPAERPSTPAERPSTPAERPSTPAGRLSAPVERWSALAERWSALTDRLAASAGPARPTSGKPTSGPPTPATPNPTAPPARPSPAAPAEPQAAEPARATPAEATTAASAKAAPGQAAPGKTAPGKTAPGKTAPGKTAPGKAAPGERSTAAGDWAGRGDGPPRQAKREPWPPPLFSMPDAAAPSRRLPSTTTRRLCAAVHLDPDLARRVVAELTDDPHRAVPPSVGFDLEPVLCHAVRARLLSTARDAVLAVAVLVALILAPRTTAAVLLLGGAAGLARARLVRAVPAAGRALFAAALVFGLVAMVGAVLTVLAALPTPTGGGEFDRLAGVVGAEAGPRVWVAVGLLAVAATAAHLAHLWWTGATLAAATHPVPLRAATAGRVAVVAAAQRGNVGFSRADPFVGAGPQVRAWSVAVALRAIDSGVYRPRSPATFDPVLLRRHVGQALQGLGDGGAGHAGVPGLTVTPYLAADGVRCAGDPLLDGGTPLPLASREALDAVVRGPQESLRLYDRVVIVPRARAVTTVEGRSVVPADDGDGYVSVFVHTSIEASVVYVELSAHVMPPIRTSCYVSGAAGVHLETLTQLTGAPWRLAVVAARGLRTAAGRAQRGGWHDHSARLGVRELAGEPDGPALEAAKYVKVVERVVVEAVADFLERYDLDATAFRAEVPGVR